MCVLVLLNSSITRRTNFKDLQYLLRLILKLQISYTYPNIMSMEQNRVHKNRATHVPTTDFWQCKSYSLRVQCFDKWYLNTVFLFIHVFLFQQSFIIFNEHIIYLFFSRFILKYHCKLYFLNLNFNCYCIVCTINTG